MAAEFKKTTCQCGAVSFPVSAAEPLGIYICHCLECRKQSSSAFGITYLFYAEGMWPPKSQETRDNMSLWTRPTDSGNTSEAWFCRHCGSRMVHRSKLPDGTYKKTISVKGGCYEGFGNLEKARHIFTRSAVVPVPEDSDLAEPSGRPG